MSLSVKKIVSALGELNFLMLFLLHIIGAMNKNTKIHKTILCANIDKHPETKTHTHTHWYTHIQRHTHKHTHTHNKYRYTCIQMHTHIHTSRHKTHTHSRHTKIKNALSFVMDIQDCQMPQLNQNTIFSKIYQLYKNQFVNIKKMG